MVSVMNHVILHPSRDYIQSCSEEERLVSSWLKSAKSWKLGSFAILTPSDSPTASAIIYPAKPNHFPRILITDMDKDGKLDSISIVDSAYHIITVNDNAGDGVFDSYNFTPKGNTLPFDGNSLEIRYTDMNLDAQYDFSLGPGYTASVFIDSRWHDLITKDKGNYIDINGTVKKVKYVGGVWRIVEE
jgi:hypothetical protein